MISKLPEWYRLSNLKSSEEELEKRSEVINESSKLKDEDWNLDLIRAYLGKLNTQDDFYNKIREKFLQNDPMFRQSGNELELRVLAGAILHYKIIETKSNDNYKVILSFLTALFGITETDILNIDIVEDVRRYFLNESNNLRDKSLPKSNIIPFKPTDSISDWSILNDNFKNVGKLLNISNNSVEELNNKFKSISEEVNVLWWFTSKYSRDLNIPFNDIENKFLPIVLGKELADLTNFILPPISSKGILTMLLSENSKVNNKYKITDVINSANRDWKEKIIVKDVNKMKLICPLTVAVVKSLELGSPSWKESFKSFSGFTANNQFTKIDFAYQFYIECMLLKTLIN